MLQAQNSIVWKRGVHKGHENEIPRMYGNGTHLIETRFYTLYEVEVEYNNLSCNSGHWPELREK